MPMWLTIKTSKHFTDGSKLAYQAIQSIIYLLKHLLDVVNPMIKRNSFVPNQKTYCYPSLKITRKA